MRLNDLHKSEYNIRDKKLQKKLGENDLNVGISYSREGETGVIRYCTVMLLLVVFVESS